MVGEARIVGAWQPALLAPHCSLSRLALLAPHVRCASCAMRGLRGAGAAGGLDTARGARETQAWCMRGRACAMVHARQGLCLIPGVSVSAL
jgi:hypothetical protein